MEVFSVLREMYPILVSIIVVILMGVIFLYNKQNYYKRIPPGPRGYPIIGNILDLTPSEILVNVRKFRKEYGDFFTIRMGTKLTVVVSGYENLKELFNKKGDAVSDRPPLFLFKDLFNGLGVGPNSGYSWKIHRSFALKTLRSPGFEKRSMESNIMEEIGVLLNEIERHERISFNSNEILKTCISNVICSLAFGQSFDHRDPKFKAFLSMIDDIFEYTGVSGPISVFPFLKYLPGDPFRAKRLLKCFKEFWEYIQDFIDEHKISFDPENTRDYIDAYLKEKKRLKEPEKDTFTDQQLRASVAELFIAGTEATTTILNWFVLYLLHHPSVQAKMWTEIEAFVGISRLPSLNDKPKLPYCEAVVTEVMRCANTGPFSLMHCASKDVLINNLLIPKGCILIQNLDSVLKDPELFPNPEEFRPERFIDTNGKLGNHEKVIPFSIGRRACVGESLARAILFLFSTSLVQRFEILPVEGQPMPSLEGIHGLNYVPRSFDWFPVKRL